MTDAALDAPAPAPAWTPGSSRLQLRAAFRALRGLLADKEDTTKVFEIMRALNGRSTARGYQRLLRTAKGGEIAYRRQELAALLDDDAAMEALPAGSVGAAYLAWRRAEGLSAAGLAQISRQVGNQPRDVEHPFAWFGRRVRDTHDLWHVLSGYGRDGLGEACLVAFSYAQTGGLGWAFIALGAGVQAIAQSQWAAAGAIVEGWRRGRRAGWLCGEDYLALLAEPLDAARARLKLDAPVRYRRVLASLAAQGQGQDADGPARLAAA